MALPTRLHAANSDKRRKGCEEIFYSIQHSCLFQTQFIDQELLSGGISYQDDRKASNKYRMTQDLPEAVNDNRQDIRA